MLTFAGSNRAARVLRFQQTQHVKNISTTFTLVSIDSVWLAGLSTVIGYKKEKCLVKSGKDK